MISSALEPVLASEMHHRRGKKNPVSGLTATLLVGGALVAATVVGVALFERSAKAKGGGGGPVKTINVGIQDVGGTVHANAGDTIAVTLGPPFGGGTYVDQSVGGVSFKDAPQGTFQMLYSVSSSGTIGIGQMPGNPVQGCPKGQVKNAQGGCSPAPQVFSLAVVVP